MPNLLLAAFQLHQTDLTMYALVIVFMLAIAWIMNGVERLLRDDHLKSVEVIIKRLQPETSQLIKRRKNGQFAKRWR